MRTGTGVVEEVCPNGLAKIQTNRNNLYSPCSDSMCADNVVIDAVNPIGAKKGQYVQFNIPDAGMGVKGIICFGVPLLLIIVCGVAGYLLGESWQVKPEMTAFAGMIAGGAIGGALAGIFHVTTYVLGATNILGIVGFVAGGTFNMVMGCIASAVAFIAAAAISYSFGFTKEQLEGKEG